MQLNDMQRGADPIRIMLAGHLSASDLSRVCSAMKNSTPHVIRNTVLDEGLLDSISKTALLKSRAISLIPHEVKNNPQIAKLLRVAKQSEELVTDKDMVRWWQSLDRIIKKQYNIMPKHDLISPIMARVKKEQATLQDELAASELSDYEADINAGKVSDDKKQSENSEEEKKKRKAKTLAKLLGIEDGDDVDYETLDDLINGQFGNGGRTGTRGRGNNAVDRIKSLRRMLQKMRSDLKPAKGLNKEDAQLLLRGVTNMVIAESTNSSRLCEDGVLSNIASMFSRGGRRQMGSRMVNGAIKDFLTALAVASMARMAKSISAKENDVYDDDDFDHETGNEYFDHEVNDEYFDHEVGDDDIVPNSASGNKASNANKTKLF